MRWRGRDFDTFLFHIDSYNPDSILESWTSRLPVKKPRKSWTTAEAEGLKKRRSFGIGKGAAASLFWMLFSAVFGTAASRAGKKERKKEGKRGVKLPIGHACTNRTPFQAHTLTHFIRIHNSFPRTSLYLETRDDKLRIKTFFLKFTVSKKINISWSDFTIGRAEVLRSVLTHSHTGCFTRLLSACRCIIRRLMQSGQQPQIDIISDVCRGNMKPNDNPKANLVCTHSETSCTGCSRKCTQQKLFN